MTTDEATGGATPPEDHRAPEDEGPTAAGLQVTAWLAGLGAIGCWIWLAVEGGDRGTERSTLVTVQASLVVLVGFAVASAVLCGVKNVERRLRAGAPSDG